MIFTRKNALPILLLASAVVCAGLTACGDDDDDDGAGGTAGTTGKGGSGGTAGTAGTGGTGGTEGGTQTLCLKYGGANGVKTAVGVAVGKVAADCRINAFFTTLTETKLNHVVECLTIQSQELFGCAGITYSGAKDSKGVDCRSMTASHQGLNISDADFTAFIEDVAAGLTEAGVSSDDLGAASPALVNLKPQIVTTDAGATSRAACSDAGPG